MWNRLPPMDIMEQDSVILPIITVIVCILVFGIIICWCLSQMRHRNPTDVVPQWQVPKGRLYPESAVFQSSRSRVPGFSEFIRNVIDLFNGQRQEGDQFAVLIFTAEHKLSRMGNIQFRAPQHATDYVNKNYSYFPRGDLTNYLVARPDNGRHCEEIMLDQEYRLWNAYKDHHSTGPRCIILYSWLLPCSDCTREIIAYHTHTRPAVKLIVVFTAKWHYLDESENDNNITRMQEAGIDVHRVSYPYQLPPAEAF